MADRSALVIAGFFAAGAAWILAAHLAAERRGGNAPYTEEQATEESSAMAAAESAGRARAATERAQGEAADAADTADTARIGDCQRVAGDRAEPAPCAEIAPGWPPEIAYGAPYDALKPLEFSSAAAARAVFDAEDDYSGLPRDAGYELVDAYCTACHSLQIVMQQRYAREGWDRRLDWMVETQGMAEMPTEDRAIVLDYLARHF